MGNEAIHVGTALSDRRLKWAGYLIGIALGGIFDGILLHQVLQWHHLLGALEGDVRFQVMADGLFHGAMYVIACVGLWKLFKARRAFAKAGAVRVLLANVLIGFGAWHVLDGILSHWILGIHRIRMDVPNPLFWDLIWIFLFGVLFIAAGYSLRRRSIPTGCGNNDSSGPGEKN